MCRARCGPPGSDRSLRSPPSARPSAAIRGGEHWYLAALGTDPEAQGRGLAAAVLAPVLDGCDTDGLGAYLESSKEQNLPFYARHGFAVTGTIDLSRGGPRLWTMWRDPRPLEHGAAAGRADPAIAREAWAASQGSRVPR